MQLIYGFYGCLGNHAFQWLQCILAALVTLAPRKVLEAVMEFYKLPGLLVNVVHVGN